MVTLFFKYNANGGWAKGHSTGELQLKRGDYIQILGGYWGNNDAKHTEYHIKRLN